MNIKNQKDFFSGLLFMVVGGAFAWGSFNFTLGTSANMGPGYFPLALGCLLAVLGSAIAFKALVVETEDGVKVGAFAWRPLVFIILANLVFGAMVGGLPSIHLPALGLVAGIYAVTFISALASDGFKWKEVTGLATVLATAGYFVFIKLLHLPFSAWPAFVGG